MGLLDDLFGGSNNVNIQSRSQRRVSNSLGDLLQEQIGQGVDPYTGQIVPGGNSNLSQAFGSAQSTLAPIPGMQGAVQELLAGAGDPAVLQQMFQDQLMPANIAHQDNMREVRNRYGSTHGNTGALPYMEAMYGSRFDADQQRLLGEMVYGDRQAALDRQLGAVNAGNNMSQINAQNLGFLTDIGFAERGLEAERNAEAYQKWFGSQAYNNPWLQLVGTHLGTQTMGQQQQPNIIGGLANAAQGFGKAYGAIV